MVKTTLIELDTVGFCDIRDITSELELKMKDSGLKSGVITVFVPGATGAVTTIEFEDGNVRDFKAFWEKIIPKDEFYAHNARWGDGNGFSHIRASVLGPSLSIPFVEGKLTLGTWQQVIFIDFDNRRRSRTIVVQLMGE
ncbi:MAG: secondary thiamine-phosphate synthase enzyme YjbQ [Firmicutes bacterium]|nr:secondary thiamine-phosphate synthase enzyme YjbQ [Bacillota bacterium]